MATSRDPWQDPMTVNISVPASRSLEAADVFNGFAGSWAAEYVLQNGVMNQFSPVEGNPAPIYRMSSHLGHPGFPEINFLPYSHGTNRIGPKGGSLLGCPISFSVVGPTLKRGGKNNWQWKVVDNSAGAGGDTLTLDDSVVDFGVDPPVPGALAATVADHYGITTLADCPDGLYLVISHTGNAGTLLSGGAPVAGGVGDGDIWQFADGNTRYPLVPLASASKYEIFRVTTVAGNVLTLDPTKRLKDYFTFHAAGAGIINSVRGVTLMEPKATRLVAVPDSGTAKGLEQTFVVVPPLRAANDDQQYPYAWWHNANFTEEGWYGAVAQSDGMVDSYSNFEYRNPPQLPVGKPVGQATFRLIGIAGEGSPPDIGPARFMLVPTTASGWGTMTPTVGNLIRVNNIRVVGDVELSDSTSGGVTRRPQLNTLLGWFEIVREIGLVAPYTIVVRRVNETDPTTGRTFLGNATLLCLDQSVVPAADETIELDCTVHPPVSALWTSTYYDADAVESSRLTNLIDPSWSGRSIKGIGNGLLARSDKAIFDTTPSSNPGSLLDLGFRMVIFPATTRTINIPDPTHAGPPWAEPYQAVDVLVPDFEHPLESQEVILDGSKPDEAQYVEVDYANGLVRFSHPIMPGSPLYNAAVFNHVDNPRNEMVLFASCVPYSREPGQLGSGIRATGGTPINEIDVPCLPQGTEHDSADVFGARTVVPLLDTVTNTVDPTRNDPTQALVLPAMSELSLPSAGFVEILDGVSADGDPSFYGTTYRGSLFGYYALLENPGVSITLFGRYGGSIPASTKSYDATTPGVVVARREVIVPNTTDGVAGVPYQYDVTYGHAKRSSTVRFGDSELTSNADGSITVTPRDTIAKSIQDTLSTVLGTVNLLDDGLITCTSTLTTTTFMFSSITYLFNGEHHQHGPASLVVSKDMAVPLTIYLVWNPYVCGIYYATSIPQVGSVLLAKAVIPVSGTGANAVLTDLRYPLKDFDERTDVLVGTLQGTPVEPWFPTLAKAVAYVSEMMDPDSGDPSRSMKIKVVGNTPETETPIVIKTDGLIIEGMGVGPDDAGIQIQWTSGPLFDLNGHKGLEFRGLTFVCKEVVANTIGQSTITATTATGGAETLPVYIAANTTPWVDVSEVIPGTGIVIDVGNSTDLTAVTDGSAEVLYTWFSSDPAIASVVVGPGLTTTVTGVTHGSVDIWAVGDSTNKIGTWHINVWDAGDPASTFIAGPRQCRIGHTVTLQAQLYPGAPEVVTWASSSTAFGVVAGVCTPSFVPNVVFTGDAERLTIEGCKAFGYHQMLSGFIQVEDDLAVHQLSTWKIRDNYVEPTDFFLRMAGTLVSIDNLDVCNNVISWNGQIPAFYAYDDCAAIRVRAAETTSVFFEKNTLDSWGSLAPLTNLDYLAAIWLGITLAAPYAFGNYPLEGDFTWAISTAGGTSVEGMTFRDNKIDNGTASCSMVQLDNQDVFDRNSVVSDTGFCQVRLGTACKMDGNYIYRSGVAANPTELAVIWCGTNCTVTNNNAGQIILNDGCQIIGNNFINGIGQWDIAPHNPVFEGNLVGYMGFAAAPWSAYNDFSAVNLLSEFAVYNGNHFTGHFTCNAGSDHTVFSNNMVRGTANVDLSGDYHTVNGNILESGNLLTGANCKLQGNVVGGNITVTTGCLLTVNSAVDITVGAGCSVIGNSFTNLLPAIGDPDAITPVIGNRISGNLFGAAGPFVGSYTGNRS